MRSECERCNAPLTRDGAAWVCAYECTFSTACADALARVCPNCGGELMRRPRSVPKPESAAA
ncbi:MAG: DUF1272 domain-containing protein [Rhodanobacteraceae bacterium]